MDEAATRAGKKLESFRLKLNRFKQEEITKEIEVILLNVKNGEN